MKDTEIFADIVTHINKTTHSLLADLSPAELAWRADPEANSIGVTVWHYSRWLDLIPVRLLDNRPAEEEQWHTQGWAARTGYDPRGIGYAGFGAITGYTQEEVAAIPEMSREDLLTYLDQACTVLRERFLAMPEGALDELALNQKGTFYALLKKIFMGTIGHLGEIEALKSIQVRARKTSL